MRERERFPCLFWIIVPAGEGGLGHWCDGGRERLKFGDPLPRTRLSIFLSCLSFGAYRPSIRIATASFWPKMIRCMGFSNDARFGKCYARFEQQLLFSPSPFCALSLSFSFPSLFPFSLLRSLSPLPFSLFPSPFLRSLSCDSLFPFSLPLLPFALSPPGPSCLFSHPHCYSPSPPRFSYHLLTITLSFLLLSSPSCLGLGVQSLLGRLNPQTMVPEVNGVDLIDCQPQTKHQTGSV